LLYFIKKWLWGYHFYVRVMINFTQIKHPANLLHIRQGYD